MPAHRGIPPELIDLFDMAIRGDAIVERWDVGRNHAKDMTEWNVRIIVPNSVRTVRQGYSGGSYQTNMAQAAVAMNQLTSSLNRLEQLQPPDKVVDIGTGTHPILAYRDFIVTEEMRLESRNGARWIPRKAHHAVCLPIIDVGKNFKRGSLPRSLPHDAPQETCACGIYAFDSLDHPDMQTFAIAYAEVLLWGDVFICETGYRAEFAYPKTIFIKKGDAPRWSALAARELEDAYGVPVHVVEARGLSHEEVIDNEIKKLLEKNKK